jgi:hypothetical protein
VAQQEWIMFCAAQAAFEDGTYILLVYDFMLEACDGGGVLEINHILIGMRDGEHTLADKFTALQRDTAHHDPLMVYASGPQQSGGCRSHRQQAEP